MASDPAPRSERRADDRRIALALAEISLDGGTESMSGVLRNISASGAQFYVNRHIGVGTRLRVTVHFTMDGEEHTIRSDAVTTRSELLDSARMALWIRSIGVRFCTKLDARLELIEGLSGAATCPPVRAP